MHEQNTTQNANTKGKTNLTTQAQKNADPPKATTCQAPRLIVAISKNYFELDISHMGNITS